MGLLKRLGQRNNDDDEKTISSAMLEVSSAWSVWPDVKKIPALKTLAENVGLSAEAYYPPGQWAVIGTNGVIYANPLRFAPAAEWQFVLAHLLAHLGLKHRPTTDPAWNVAQELTANALTLNLEIGTPPQGFTLSREGDTVRQTDAEQVRASLNGPLKWVSGAGANLSDLIPSPVEVNERSADEWAMMLTHGLLQSFGGRGGLAPWATVGLSRPRQALRWFVDNFPLLSALASHFSIIEDRDTVTAFNVGIAAVIAERMEILVNPEADLTPAELRFIMGHELMHVGLLHHVRQEDRDHFIWNLACDFVINAWLIDMGVGDMPPRGGLYDARFVGMSANAIYDLLIQDPDYARTLITFRGVGVGDILPPGALGKARTINGKAAADLAEELMKQGIDSHMAKGRGLLPAGLMEMITPTTTPPPPWKLPLSTWFENHFEPVAPARSYFRQSRRQQATPDIPRPRYAVPQFPDGSAIFGVMLDTSGSMDNDLLAQCLGAIASLASRHNIKQVRLVFCDVVPHDEGYVPIKRLTQPMHVKGRGGTKLQPGIDAFDKIKDFPKEAPLLVITDGACEPLTVNREHAFLIPEGNELPFVPVGPVFRLA
ncbi:MAG TPA: VWA-like domain-containing protein [Aggregatilineales bacterium]|nr:VWA-like domain-containing protein [Aggregatilineales bacterium]